jgi:pimeloyl-ACP methyl ester carboxylesterase
MIDNTSQLSSVPAAIYAVYNGDMNQIEANLGYATVFPRGNVMGQVVDCNDRKPFETAEMFEVWYTSVSDYVGLEVPIPQNQVEPCSIGEYRNPPLVENEPLTSDIPTLLLNGEYDARTPAAFALHAAETLPNSFTYVLPYTGHAAISVGGCVIDIMQDFLDDPASEPASASECISLLEQRFQWSTGK